jgi:hypothetical protein
LDISREVFKRSARMGIGYVIIGTLTGILVTAAMDVAARYASVPVSGVQSGDIGAALGLLVIPLAALGGLIVTTPVYLLFVNDKNVGVLEYLLAVGMGQRDVFQGYLKAALLLSMIAVVPAVLLNLVLSPAGLTEAVEGGGLALVTGVADVALVTVLMTSFSSMQRKPTGMNSPLGIGVGVFILLPELVLFTAFGTAILWLDLVVALAIMIVAMALLLSLDRLISREKLLP